MTEKTKSELITRIIELEFEITSSIIEGHKPFLNDHFQDKRNELRILRCLLFGYESQYCNKFNK